MERDSDLNVYHEEEFASRLYADETLQRKTWCEMNIKCKDVVFVEYFFSIVYLVHCHSHVLFFLFQGSLVLFFFAFYPAVKSAQQLH